MPETLLDRARTAAGAGMVRPADRPADRVDGVAPAVVIEPDSVDGVAAALAWAASSRLSVVVRGGGTRDRYGRRPRPFDVLLRLDRLDRVLAHEASDLTATVEAGAPLRDVNAALARHRQQLPLDGTRGVAGTIGGLLAANEGGPLRHRYGLPRDLVIGMTFVLGDGLRASSGGRVVKNVAGYDLARMMAGSHGTLGAIVSATFKLAPLPPATRTIRVRLRRVSDATALADLLRKAQCEAEALELSWRHSGGSERDETSVLVRFGSVAAAVEDGSRQVLRCVREIDGQAETLDGGEADACWLAHAASGTERQTTARLSWRPTELDRAAAALREAAGDLPLHWIGRLAVGSGTVTLGGPADAHAAVVGRLRTSPALRHVTIVDAPAGVREAIDPWTLEPDTEMLWRALQTACDPHGVLGAGRGPL